MSPFLQYFFERVEPILVFIIAAVFAFKGILFVLYKNNDWKLVHFLYFEDTKIATSRNLKRATIKIIQNCLSYYLVFLIILHLGILLFIKQ